MSYRRLGFKRYADNRYLQLVSDDRVKKKKINELTEGETYRHQKRPLKQEAKGKNMRLLKCFPCHDIPMTEF